MNELDENPALQTLFSHAYTSTNRCGNPLNILS
jgi:hypothetical protein